MRRALERSTEHTSNLNRALLVPSDDPHLRVGEWFSCKGQDLGIVGPVGSRLHGSKQDRPCKGPRFLCMKFPRTSCLALQDERCTKLMSHSSVETQKKLGYAASEWSGLLLGHVSVRLA